MNNHRKFCTHRYPPTTFVPWSAFGAAAGDPEHEYDPSCPDLRFTLHRRAK